MEEYAVSRKRELWVDAVRGFTIYLVVLGHCIQYATPLDYDFKGNLIFRLIYGFHMPLFMIISGYLFWYSLQRYHLWDGLLAKLKGIMIPCMAWGFVTYLCDIILFGFQDISIGGYIYYTIYSNWFLWAVFYCSLYGFITKYVFRDNLVGYAVLILVNYLLPDFGNFTGAKRLFPFFLMGMLLNRYHILEKIESKMEATCIILTGICYGIVLKFQCVELITGTIGSACIILLFHVIYKYHMERKAVGDCAIQIGVKFLQKLGEVSICIYLFTGIVFYFVVKEYLRISDSYRYRIKAAYVFVLSWGLTVLAYVLGRLLQKNKMISKLFMGR